MATVDASAVQDLPDRYASLNQLVAYNVAYWRRVRDLTQEELGTALGELTGRPWSKATVSALERSWDGRRVRQIDMDDLFALGRALDVSMNAFFLPPYEDGAVATYHFGAAGTIASGDLALTSSSLRLVADLFPGTRANTDAYWERLETVLESYIGEESVYEVPCLDGGSSAETARRVRYQTNALRSVLRDLERQSEYLDAELKRHERGSDAESSGGPGTLAWAAERLLEQHATTLIEVENSRGYWAVASAELRTLRERIHAQDYALSQMHHMLGRLRQEENEPKSRDLELSLAKEQEVRDSLHQHFATVQMRVEATMRESQHAEGRLMHLRTELREIGVAPPELPAHLRALEESEGAV